MIAKCTIINRWENEYCDIVNLILALIIKFCAGLLESESMTLIDVAESFPIRELKYLVQSSCSGTHSLLSCTSSRSTAVCLGAYCDDFCGIHGRCCWTWTRVWWSYRSWYSHSFETCLLTAIWNPEWISSAAVLCFQLPRVLWTSGLSLARSSCLKNRPVWRWGLSSSWDNN